MQVNNYADVILFRLACHRIVGYTYSALLLHKCSRLWVWLIESMTLGRWTISLYGVKCMAAVLTRTTPYLLTNCTKNKPAFGLTHVMAMGRRQDWCHKVRLYIRTQVELTLKWRSIMASLNIGWLLIAVASQKWNISVFIRRMSAFNCDGCIIGILNSCRWLVIYFSKCKRGVHIYVKWF